MLHDKGISQAHGVFAFFLAAAFFSSTVLEQNHQSIKSILLFILIYKWLRGLNYFIKES
jgi:hypothetical protein